LRVAIVRQRYNPYGGAERFIERAIPALERAGVELTLVGRSRSVLRRKFLARLVLRAGGAPPLARGRL
jgi:hypothetical protein